MSKNLDRKEGVYVSRHGHLKLVSFNPETRHWIVEEGKKKMVKFLMAGLSCTIPMVHEASEGYPLEQDVLRHCEFIGEF
jgi:hypothetical protein